MPKEETRRIRVDIKGSGSKELRRIAKDMGKISRNTKKTATALDKFQKIFRTVTAGTIAGVGIKAVLDAADSFQLLRDRIRSFEGDRADETFNQLAEAAKFTKSSISGLAETYSRVALATKELGLSSEAVIGLTTGLQQTFRLSGATLAEASGAAIQLSQGLASGALRGQELRSVLEANAEFGGILARELNTTRGNLIKFAETGAITSKVVLKALSRNFADLNKRAAVLGQTFEQTIIIALDNFKLKIDSINRSLGLNSKFAKGLDLIIENLELLAAGVATLLTAAILPSLISTLSKLKLAVDSVSLSVGLLQAQFAGGIILARLQKGLTFLLNPVTLLAGAITFLALTWEKSGKQIELVIESFRQKLLGFLGETARALAEGAGIFGLDTLQKKFTLFGEAVDEEGAATKKNIDILIDALAEIEAKGNGFGIEKFTAALRTATNNIEDANGKLIPFSKRLAKLNREYLKSKNINEYNRKLKELQIEELTSKFKKGSVTLGQFNDQLEKIQGKKASPLVRLNEQFQIGRINLIKYNEELRKLEIERLKKGVEEGTSSVKELNQALLTSSEKFQPGNAILLGASNYVEQVGTLSQNIAGAITNTFTRLEDSLVEFTKTGKFVFKDFAQAILDDLNRILIRQLIVRQLANAVTSVSFSGGDLSGGSSDLAFAKGGAFNRGNVIPFASGGVVDQPTLFGFGGNKMGVMGEAGTEAILPLTRSSDGDLGVKATPSTVNVNIINNSGAEVSQRESEDAFGNRTVDVIIQSSVQEGIANGTFDKTLQQSFGLSRRAI